MFEIPLQWKIKICEKIYLYSKKNIDNKKKYV